MKWPMATIMLLQVCLPTHSDAQVIAPSRVIDWTNAGIVGGIPNRTTICATFSSGATAAQINAAIASCPNGQVVFLNAGTYNFTTGLIFSNKSNVTLRGAGADVTSLVFSGNNACGGYNASICVMGNSTWYGSPYITTSTDWTAGYAKNATQITVASTAGLSVGQVVVLDQLNDTTDTGTVLVCDTTGPPLCSREGGSPGRANRAQEQYVRVTAINGNVLTIWPGLHMPNWRSSQSPQVFVFGPQSASIGIENLSINNLNAGGMGGIVFHNAYQSWVQGVKSLYGRRNHVWLIQAAGIELRNNYFYGPQSTASQSYAVESFLASDCLIINNIFQHTTIPMIIGNNTGSVYAYNYSIDDVYYVATWMQPSQLIHDAGVDNLLLEGNVGAGLQSDLFHGTSNFVTAFRNYYNGWETGKTQNTIPIQIQAKHRFYNFVGNVLGRSAYHNNYQSTPPSGTNGGTSIYVLGWSGQQGTTDNIVTVNDPLVVTTSLRWGNYDTFTGTSRFLASEVPSALSDYPNPVPSSQTLPASQFLSSSPTWFVTPFGTVPWPPIGPDVAGGPGPGGHAYKIPAQLCYENSSTGGDGTLVFNAGNCYRSTPAPPSNLIVQ